MAKANRLTKKDLAVGMYEKGLRVETIAELLESDPSYIANALIERGHVPNYVDLYTSTGPQNRYAAMLQGVLRFRNVEAAQESIARIDALHRQFAAVRDRRGMHQCELLALTGKNRAEGLGKLAEARVFAEWLKERLTVPAPEAATLRLPLPEAEPGTEAEPAASRGPAVQSRAA